MGGGVGGLGGISDEEMKWMAAVKLVEVSVRQPDWRAESHRPPVGPPEQRICCVKQWQNKQFRRRLAVKGLQKFQLGEVGAVT